MSFTLVVRASGNRGAARALAWFSSGLSEGRHTVTSGCRSLESRPHGVTDAMPSGHLSGAPRAFRRCGRCRRGTAGATAPRAHTPKSPASFPKQPLGPMCLRQGEADPGLPARGARSAAAGRARGRGPEARSCPGARLSWPPPPRCPRPGPGRPAAPVPSAAAAGRAAPGRARRGSASAPPPPAARSPTGRSRARGPRLPGAEVVGVLELRRDPSRAQPLSRGRPAGNARESLARGRRPGGRQGGARGRLCGLGH